MLLFRNKPEKVLQHVRGYVYFGLSTHRHCGSFVFVSVLLLHGGWEDPSIRHTFTCRTHLRLGRSVGTCTG
jgi:hypothetical protein